MRKNLYLTILSFSLVSCYTYQVKKQPDVAADNKQEAKRNVNPDSNVSVQKNEAKNANSPQAAAPMNVQEILTPNKNVRIDVADTTYKIIVDRWESDSLVAHPVNNPKKILKFHKNQINSEKIAEKRFSKPIADIITIMVYAGIGVGVWALLR